jgi:MATE family, multidrug efflux pump
MFALRRTERWPRSAAGSGVAAELGATVALAAPLAAANLAQMAMAVTNTAMIGRLGAVPLAAAGLAGTVYFTGGFMLQGILYAVAPLGAHALGAGNRDAAGRIAGAGLALSVFLALPFVIAAANIGRLLAAFGYDPALAAEIARYLRAIVWGGPAFLGFEVLACLCAVLARTRAVMAVLLVCIAGNAFLNWVLIFGHLGLPALGVAGSGYASAFNQWLMLAGLALCVRLMPAFSGLRLLRNACAVQRAELAKILRLGLPIGTMRGIEFGVFTISGILIGLLGAAALGAHQIALTTASITYMVPLGLGQAATVRVAHELGAGRPRGARRAGFVALALGIAFMTVMASVLWTCPRPIIGVFINASDPGNREIVGIARHLLAIAALFQVVDGIQATTAGTLRGYRDTMVPMLLAAFGYWGAGFIGGALLAFPLGHGAAGMWWGLALGLAVVAALLTLRLDRLARRIERGAEAVTRRVVLSPAGTASK